MRQRHVMGWFPAAVLTIVTLGPPNGLRLGAEQDAEGQFLQSVESYMALRRQLEHQLPPNAVSPDVDAIKSASHARFAAMRRARADARPGDIFNAGVAELYRVRIRHGFTVRGEGASSALIKQMNEGGKRVRPAVVNGRFSWKTAAATPPHVLAVLPDLPPELQYRFVGSDLVLVDLDASFIVDVLPDVLDLPPHRGNAP
jgi:hypothetical protein